MFKLAEQAGYEVAYKGKMHLFTPQGTPSPDSFSSYDIKWVSDHYRANRWNPPDSALDPGGDVWIAGGWPNNDARYVSGVPDTFNRMTPAVGGGETILQYLDNYDPKEDKPFLLVCSFGNPHDISVWPDQDKWGYDKADYAKLKEINLPSNYNDDLKEKPVGQKEFQKLTDKTDPAPAHRTVSNTAASTRTSTPWWTGRLQPCWTSWTRRGSPKTPSSSVSQTTGSRAGPTR